MITVVKNPILKRIFGKQLTEKIYFISPHLDDAIFSAGGLITTLLDEGIEFEIINIFTSCGQGISTLSARKFLFDCGYKSSMSLYKDRVSEDSNIWNSIGVKAHYLGEVDALWRTTNNKKSYFPELFHVYPTFRFHISKGIVSRLDNSLISDVATKINTITQGRGIFLCPVAGGIHVDHQIARLATELVTNKTIYWKDFPYNPEVKIHSKFKTVMLKGKKREKYELISRYKSQIKAIFKSNLKLKDELFYILPYIEDISVEIGIPALNEQEHIGPLVSILDSQHLVGMSNYKINVISDGSVDNTNEIVRKLSLIKPKVKLYEFQKRQGLSKTQNFFNRVSKSDVNIILNADIAVDDRWFVRKLINPIIREGAGLVSCMIRAKVGKSTMSRILKTVSDLKEEVYQQTNNGDNIYACHGPARAFVKSLYKQIRYFEDSGEDGFSYIYAKTANYIFKYQSIAELGYTNPQNIRDYLNQSLRFQGLKNILVDYFENSLVDKYTHIPIFSTTLLIMKSIFTPLKIWYFLGYIILFIYSRLLFLFPGSNYRGMWAEVKSSKQLI